ncbi:MAG: inorganic diphosphatase [Myxococcales bacterium]|nr:inorganic diphosphatase [Myxococcales bacterium]
MRQPNDDARAAAHQGLPAQCTVRIELPRGGVLKRREDGRLDFLSPLPCPFNYGSVPGTRSGDGDRIDAIVLGPRLAAGSEVTLPVLAVADFLDAGAEDPKWICGQPPLSRRAQAGIDAFMRLYALCKRQLNRLRGLRGTTLYRGLVLR